MVTQGKLLTLAQQPDKRKHRNQSPQQT